jgi:hypothetical protein
MPTTQHSINNWRMGVHLVGATDEVAILEDALNPVATKERLSTKASKSAVSMSSHHQQLASKSKHKNEAHIAHTVNNKQQKHIQTRSHNINSFENNIFAILAI